MKTKNIKSLLVVAICAFGINGAKAQDVQMATLQHGETVSVYYGADALKSAYTAAEAGDQISLSGGTFNSVNIEKPLKIYGAGAWTQDAAKNKYITYLTGDFTIKQPDGVEGLHIEGICCQNRISCQGDITAMTFKKCYLNDLDLQNANTTNCNINQCWLIKFNPDDNSKILCVSNSVIEYLKGNNAEATFSLLNCVVSNTSSTIVSAMFKNSVVYTYYINGIATISYYNCIVSHNPSGIKDNVVVYYFNNSDWKGLLTNDFWHLADDHKNKVTGTDGTEIGIYGGSTPFSQVPSNPQVTTKEVAAQSDSNGKLKVKMVVEAQ